MIDRENDEVNKKQVEVEEEEVEEMMVVVVVVMMKEVLEDLVHRLYGEEVGVLPYTEVEKKRREYN
jgi:hypothetical protein